MLRTLCAALTLWLLTGAGALAASFDFTAGASREGAALDLVAGGIGLTVAGQGGTARMGGGLGLGVGGADDSGFTASLIESWGADTESVELRFDRAVRITSVTFSFADRDDRLGLSTLAGAATFKLPMDPSTGLATLLLDGAGWSGTTFTLAPEAWMFCTWFGTGEMCETRHSGFRITGVEVVDEPGVVPLPLSGVLLLAGLGGLALVARRRETRDV